MRLSDFDYELPEELIAQEPPAERDGARMLVVYRAEQRFEDRQFREFPSFLREGDCVVLNDSRVLPSRLLAGKFEVLLLEPVSADQREWRALVRPGRKLRTGAGGQFEDLPVEVLAPRARGDG